MDSPWNPPELNNPHGVSMKKKSPKVKMKIKAAKRDWSAETAEQDGTAETGNWDTLPRSSMKVHHYEVIGGKRYKVLTVG